MKSRSKSGQTGWKQTHNRPTLTCLAIAFCKLFKVHVETDCQTAFHAIHIECCDIFARRQDRRLREFVNIFDINVEQMDLKEYNNEQKFRI